MPSPLLSSLLALAASDTLPFHMPGHHRAAAALPPELPYSLDITELPGFDDLHRPRALLRDSMARAAALFGSDAACYCVNGSTGALLAGIRAMTRRGDAVLVARNCHASVFHAVELCDLRPHWLEPATHAESGLMLGLPPRSLQAALEKHPDAALCVVTSPTYEGALSDIAAIAEILHAHNVPLLVDEAHGAHLGLANGLGFPQSAVRLGADVAVQSLHKTLPALTQAAILHRCGSRVDVPRLEHQLAVFQTSSPSYPLLASMDWLVGQSERWRRERFCAWRERLAHMHEKCAPYAALRAADTGGEAFFDPSKLALDARRFGMTGQALAQSLRQRGIEPEYALGHIVLLMTSCMDAPEHIDRLIAALEDLAAHAPIDTSGAAPPPCRLPPLGEQEIPLAEAMELPHRPLPREDALGRICAEYVWAYPPGIPLLVPGQRVTGAFLAAAAALGAGGGALRRTYGDEMGELVCVQGR